MKTDLTEHKCDICGESYTDSKHEPGKHKKVRIEREISVSPEGERIYVNEKSYDLCEKHTTELKAWIGLQLNSYNEEREEAKMIALGDAACKALRDMAKEEAENGLWDVIKNWDTFPVGSWTVHVGQKVSLANVLIRTRNIELKNKVKCRTCVSWVDEEPNSNAKEGTWDLFQIQGTKRCHHPKLEQETDHGTLTITHHAYGCSGYEMFQVQEQYDEAP